MNSSLGIKDNQKKILVICGPTATGKSDLAVQLAKQYNGEVISADSRQVYKDMDIGTGKITKKEMHGIPHHLLDVVSPKTIFSVVRYQKLAEKCIRDIHARGKLPIICGGTGFYIDALVYEKTIPPVPPNTELRKKLETYSTEKLFQQLQKKDPVRASTIDQYNRVRLIRALEIIAELGHVPVIASKKYEEKYKTQWTGLDTSDDVLKQRIQTRLLKRIRAGMFTEIKKLHEKGVSWKRMEELGLEYRYGSQYVRGLITKEVCIEKLETEIWHYVKRQRTWFRKNKEVRWFDVGKEDFMKEIKII